MSNGNDIFKHPKLVPDALYWKEKMKEWKEEKSRSDGDIRRWNETDGVVITQDLDFKLRKSFDTILSEKRKVISFALFLQDKDMVDKYMDEEESKMFNDREAIGRALYFLDNEIQELTMTVEKWIIEHPAEPRILSSKINDFDQKTRPEVKKHVDTLGIFLITRIPDIWEIIRFANKYWTNDHKKTLEALKKRKNKLKRIRMEKKRRESFVLPNSSTIEAYGKTLTAVLIEARLGQEKRIFEKYQSDLQDYLERFIEDAKKDFAENAYEEPHRLREFAYKLKNESLPKDFSPSKDHDYYKDYIFGGDIRKYALPYGDPGNRPIFPGLKEVERPDWRAISISFDTLHDRSPLSIELALPPGRGEVEAVVDEALAARSLDMIVDEALAARSLDMMREDETNDDTSDDEEERSSPFRMEIDNGEESRGEKRDREDSSGEDSDRKTKKFRQNCKICGKMTQMMDSRLKIHLCNKICQKRFHSKIVDQ